MPSFRGMPGQFPGGPNFQGERGSMPQQNFQEPSQQQFDPSQKPGGFVPQQNFGMPSRGEFQPPQPPTSGMMPNSQPAPSAPMVSPPPSGQALPAGASVLQTVFNAVINFLKR